MSRTVYYDVSGNEIDNMSRAQLLATVVAKLMDVVEGE